MITGRYFDKWIINYQWRGDDDPFLKVQKGIFHIKFD